jgi:hypothetical protein
MAESTLATFCFDSMEGGKLARSSQKYGVKNLLLFVSWKLPAIR